MSDFIDTEIDNIGLTSTDGPDIIDCLVDGIENFVSTCFASRLFPCLFPCSFPCLRGYQRTAGDDLREIADSLIELEQLNKAPQLVFEEIKINLNSDKTIENIILNNHYHLFYTENSIKELKYIIGNWFTIQDNCIIAKPSLFRALDEYYLTVRKRSRRFDDNFAGGWIKFAYVSSRIQPCGFRRSVRSITRDHSDNSELSEE